MEAMPPAKIEACKKHEAASLVVICIHKQEETTLSTGVKGSCTVWHHGKQGANCHYLLSIWADVSEHGCFCLLALLLLHIPNTRVEPIGTAWQRTEAW
jgi:hypothetical protein